MNQLIVKYTANVSGCLPIFNEGYQYNVNESIIEDNLYSVEIFSSQLPTSISFNGNTNLIEVHYIDTKNLTSAYNLFNKCTNLTYVNLRGADFSNVETIECMFAYCSNLLSIDGLNNIDVSKVNNMGGLFTDCPKIQKIEVNNWNVSKVTNFGAVFRRCSSLNEIDLSKWNTSSGIIMSGIFTNCSNLTIMDLSGWTVGNANTISQMFYGCKKLTTLTLFKYVDPNVQTTLLFGQCTALNKVESINSNYNTINILIDELLARTEANPGTLDIQGVDNLSLVDLELAKSKHWNVYDKANCKLNFISANKKPGKIKPGKIKHGKGTVCVITTHKRKI